MSVELFVQSQCPSENTKHTAEADNFLLDKFLEQERKNQTDTNSKKVGGLLQRSISLKSLRGNEASSFSSLEMSRHNRMSRPDQSKSQYLNSRREDDSFSVLSLDRTRRRESRQVPVLERKSHYGSEVHLPANVLAQFEAKSLFADLKRDSFRARSGTTNFALNPIFDEVVFTSPTKQEGTEREGQGTDVQVPKNFPPNRDSVSSCVISASVGEDVLDNNNHGEDFDCTSSTTTSSSSWNYSSRNTLSEQECKNNCTETTFESLVVLKRKSKFQLKDFSDSESLY